MKKFIIAFCAAVLALLSACALAETSVRVMGYPIADGEKWFFEIIREKGGPIYDEYGNFVYDENGQIVYEEDKYKLSAKETADENWNVKYESGVLTLRDISLSGVAGDQFDYNGPAIVANGDLVLCPEGYDNKLAAGGNYGMYVGGNLEVSGEGRLDITMICEPDSDKDLGIIVVSKDLTVKSGELTAAYDRAAVVRAWNSAAGVDVGGNIMVTGGYLRGDAPAGTNGVAGIRAQGDITILGGELYGYSYTCYMDKNGDRIGGNTGAGVMSEGGSIILDGGELIGADNIQYGSTDYTGVRREGAKGAGIYARKDIIIKSGALWANAYESEEGYAITCLEGEISILDESLDIGTQEYEEEKASWNGKISPGKRTIHTAQGRIARYVMIRDAKIPATGDGANLALWAALTAISAIGMAMLLRRKKKA